MANIIGLAGCVLAAVAFASEHQWWTVAWVGVAATWCIAEWVK